MGMQGGRVADVRVLRAFEVDSRSASSAEGGGKEDYATSLQYVGHSRFKCC